MGFCILRTGSGFMDSLDDKVRWLQEQVLPPVRVLRMLLNVSCISTSVY